uniref:Uncharacterized protein n=1 Tax=Zea mays TaxID=4577 RepID=C0PJF2_MAIZE|nr:unknown [Zea mays]
MGIPVVSVDVPRLYIVYIRRVWGFHRIKFVKFDVLECLFHLRIHIINSFPPGFFSLFKLSLPFSNLLLQELLEFFFLILWQATFLNFLISKILVIVHFPVKLIYYLQQAVESKHSDA